MILFEMNDVKTVSISPIGSVRNGISKVPRKPDWQLETISELIVDEKWAEGLEGIEGFSHIIVLFWFDRIRDKEVLFRVHPMHRMDLPTTGLFATRTPNRPNRIGETVVRLLAREGNVLRVLGLDALDGTPLLDIKPYLLNGDCIPTATEPQWTKERHG
jgi:tRNA (adenine37-N6)-methyltransferase